MAQPGVMTGKPLIESDRVEGTTVYDPNLTPVAVNIAGATFTAPWDQLPVMRPVDAQSFRIDWPRSLSLRACSQLRA
jgi:hypothetical protein